MTLAKKIFVIVFLMLCLTAFAGKIAIVALNYSDDSLFLFLDDTLSQEGHELDYEPYSGWRQPGNYDIFFLLTYDEYFTTAQLESLQVYVERGGNLILQECWWYPRTSDCLSDDGWPCFTGNPYWNVIDPMDSLPSYPVDSICSSCRISFLTEFSPLWKPARGIDTLTSSWFCSYTYLDFGVLHAVAFGGADASTGLYDSFPPVILNGNCGRGEITVIGSGPYMLGNSPGHGGYPPFDWLRFHDNCQFARQLFQCNERADSAWLVLENDSTAKAYLEHDSLLFMPDSSYWEVRFTVDTIRNYSFYGHEFAALGFDDSLAVKFRPGYYYDTVEVCLVRLPDSTGETILPCGRICDTFPERTGIAETPTPQSFAISAYPNPFNSSVTISLDFGSESPKPLSTIEIFDVNGRRIGAWRRHAQPGFATVKPLRDGELIWQPAPSLGSGVYLVRARFDPSTLRQAQGTAGSGQRSAQRPDGETATKRVVYLK